MKNEGAGKNTWRQESERNISNIDQSMVCITKNYTSWNSVHWGWVVPFPLFYFILLLFFFYLFIYFFMGVGGW